MRVKWKPLDVSSRVKREKEKFDFCSHLMMVYFLCTHIIKFQFSCHILNIALFPPHLDFSFPPFTKITSKNKSVQRTFKFATTIKSERKEEKKKRNLNFSSAQEFFSFVHKISYIVPMEKRRKTGRAEGETSISCFYVISIG